MESVFKAFSGYWYLRLFIMTVFGLSSIWLVNLCAIEQDSTQAMTKSKSLKWILIEKHKFKLYLIEDSDTLKVFSIAVGKNSGDKLKVGDCRTPEGNFYIIRIVNSSGWEHDFAGDGMGAIKGAYGPWFLGLYTGASVTKSGKAWTGIAIHGTHDPSSIGTLASEGCIRLRNEDILFLKANASMNMPVCIKP